MGVCIETCKIYREYVREDRHTLYGCVYWNSQFSTWLGITWSHTLYGCVYWNMRHNAGKILIRVTPYMGVCIETDVAIKQRTADNSHTLYGCVYWNNPNPLLAYQKIYVTPYMGVCIETTGKQIKELTRASHPIWVCVLKLKAMAYQSGNALSHTLYGCVYWNHGFRPTM